MFHLTRERFPIIKSNRVSSCGDKGIACDSWIYLQFWFYGRSDWIIKKPCFLKMLKHRKPCFIELYMCFAHAVNLSHIIQLILPWNIPVVWQRFRNVEVIRTFADIRLNHSPPCWMQRHHFSHESEATQVKTSWLSQRVLRFLQSFGSAIWWTYHRSQTPLSKFKEIPTTIFTCDSDSVYGLGAVYNNRRRWQFRLDLHRTFLTRSLAESWCYRLKWKREKYLWLLYDFNQGMFKEILATIFTCDSNGTMARLHQIIAFVHAVVLAFSEIFFSWVILTSEKYSVLHASPEHASLLKLS